MRLLSALHADASAFRENKPDESEIVRDPHTDNTTATPSASGVSGRPEWFRRTPPCPVERWPHAAVYPKLCENVSEGQTQRTQQSSMVPPLLLQPVRTGRARLAFTHPSWGDRSQATNNNVITSPSGKLPHAFNPESYRIPARSFFAVNRALKRDQELQRLKRCS